jgi:hypothetical protein
MKCPACKATHRRKDGPKCSKCGRPFVFFDRNEGITDQRLTWLLDRASAGGTQYFTMNQLATLWAQKVARSHGVGRMVLGGIAIAGGLIALADPAAALLAAALGASGLALGAWGVARRRNPDEPLTGQLEGWVRKWTKAGHEIPLLLTRPDLGRSPPPFREPDIFEYGVERILIVQHDLLVDLFVRNGLHTKERALVISERGYPRYLRDQAQQLLQRSPTLPVFLLHDADAEGLMMRTRLERSALLPLAGHPVIDTGLSPREVGRIKKLRALAPARRANALPADVLPYALLASGFALAFTERLPLSELVDRKDPDGSASFG